MIHRFEIVGSTSARPDADQIIFCDGTGGGLFRPETDLELSHWRPNRTPAEFRAGTSTEICFRFLDNPRPGAWTVAVNNHVDVDGILLVYVLVHNSHALAHRRTIIEAAAMGDFWGWDAEKVCLVSVEQKTGWLHELWFPGHLWADTEGKWLVPGLHWYGKLRSRQSSFDRRLRRVAETGDRTWAMDLGRDDVAIRRRTARTVSAGGTIPEFRWPTRRQPAFAGGSGVEATKRFRMIEC